jgi:hypothetical protein
MSRIRPTKAPDIAVWDENPDAKSFPDQLAREFIGMPYKKGWP